MMTQYFFLNTENIWHRKNRIAKNPRIVKFDPSIFWLRELTAPNPSFRTLDELVSHDNRFKDFKKKRPQTAILILKEENIIDSRDMILTSSNDNSQAGRMLIHLIEGNRDSIRFTGIHWLPNPLPPYIVDYLEIEPPNEMGVYIASFKVVEEGKVLSKNVNSTMFPKDWTRQILYDECRVALDKKVLVNEQERLYNSATPSGIPVKIYLNKEGNRINTLYPI